MTIANARCLDKGLSFKIESNTHDHSFYSGGELSCDFSLPPTCRSVRTE
jgi:hypothetical protein